ncbi:hypothetical protein ACMGDM_15505 [Sphingomonas sp. DT-51]|uniref:hypothetical protein n=1 Tax=Sphingomonas sp. DT-51 TaxID=3396165 RepID=UPI003F1B313F
MGEQIAGCAHPSSRRALHWIARDLGLNKNSATAIVGRAGVETEPVIDVVA